MPRPAVRLLVVTCIVLSHSTAACAASTLLLPVVDAPTGGGGTVALAPVKQRAQPTRRLVYSCVRPGHVTFADRPCGPEPNVRELKVTAPAPAAAGAVPDVTKGHKAAPVSKLPTIARSNDTDTVDEHATTCKKLHATLDDVDARMRAGYSAREAGRLWERWREAKTRLQEAHC